MPSDYELQRRAQQEAEVMKWGKRSIKVVAGTVVASVVVWAVVGLVRPQLRLYKANVEKKALIAEAKARKDSAVHLAEVDRERAKGTADANRTIAGSLTAEYIQWLYVQSLADHPGATVIYVPTEGGIPITEAGRRP
jgi:hypothetical protein